MLAYGCLIMGSHVNLENFNYINFKINKKDLQIIKNTFAIVKFICVFK